jgi:hypothetical protein
MNFDAILNSNASSNASSNIVVDTKLCQDNKKIECGIPIELKEKPTTTEKIDTADKSDKADKADKADKTADKTDQTINKEVVNIIIKSCKNITSKQALLIIPITKFFSNREMLTKLITILKGESISLRLIDWFVTNYCKKFNIMYNLNDYRPQNNTQTDAQRKSFDNFIIVHNNYKGQLKAYSKKNFDPFCRRNRIRFYYEENKYFITTVGQLNFFKWAIENYIINYIQEHIKVIDEDMNLRSETVKKTGTKINHTTHNPASINPINLINNEETKKNKPIDGTIPIETQIKTRKAGATRKKRKEISQSASKSLSIHNYPTTLIFD